MANFLEDLLRGDPKTNPTPIEYGAEPNPNDPALRGRKTRFTGTTNEPTWEYMPEEEAVPVNPQTGDGRDFAAKGIQPALQGVQANALSPREMQESLQDINYTGEALAATSALGRNAPPITAAAPPPVNATAAAAKAPPAATTAADASNSSDDILGLAKKLALAGSGARPPVPPRNTLVPSRQSTGDPIANLITANPQLLKVGKQELFALLHGIPIQGRTEIIDRINSMNQAARDASDVFLPIPYGGR